MDHAGPPAEVEQLQLLGDSLFGTPEVEDLHKDLHDFQEEEHSAAELHSRSTQTTGFKIIS